MRVEWGQEREQRIEEDGEGLEQGTKVHSRTMRAGRQLKPGAVAYCVTSKIAIQYSRSLRMACILTSSFISSFSVILVDTASNINMLSHSVTPMAYKSLKTLAQAILPTK